MPQPLAPDTALSVVLSILASLQAMDESPWTALLAELGCANAGHVTRTPHERRQTQGGASTPQVGGSAWPAGHPRAFRASFTGAGGATLRFLLQARGGARGGSREGGGDALALGTPRCASLAASRPSWEARGHVARGPLPWKRCTRSRGAERPGCGVRVSPGLAALGRCGARCCAHDVWAASGPGSGPGRSAPAGPRWAPPLMSGPRAAAWTCSAGAR